MEDTSYIPNSVQGGDAPPGNMRELTPLAELLYNMLEAVNNIQDNTFTLKLTFFQLTPEELEEKVEAYEVIEGHQPSPDLVGLHKILRYTVFPGFRITNAGHDNLNAKFTDGAINTQIRNYAIQLKPNEVNINTSTFTCLSVVLQYILTAVEFLLQKSIRACELYKSIYQWTSQLNGLNADISTMLLSLGSRTETNEKALQIARQRQEACNLFQEYVAFHNQGSYRALEIHLPGLTLHKVTFSWSELKERIRARTIWYTHCYQEDTQLLTLLQDPDLGNLSKELDKNIDKVRSFTPSSDSINVSKRERVQARAKQVKEDLTKFTTGDGKNVSRAKLLIDSFKFLNQTLEQLNLDGIPYTTEAVGSSPDEIANGIEYLESYVWEQDQIKKQKELSLKLNSVEYSKMMPGLTLTKLTGPENYLSWLVSYNSMSKIVTNPLTKVSLIKQSLGNKTDKKFLEATTSPKEALAYLKKRYSNKEEILHIELTKLYRLKKVGDDLELMVSNSEAFLLTVNLFEMHGLTDKLDRVVRNRIIERVLTRQQIIMFNCDLIKAEAQWRAKLEIASEDDQDNDAGENPEVETVEPEGEHRNVSFESDTRPTGTNASTPFITPANSPTSTSTLNNPLVEAVPAKTSLDKKYSNEQVDRIIEKWTRDLFIRRHLRIYEATRRTLYNSKMFEPDNRTKKFSRYRGGFRDSAYQVGTGNVCTLCKKEHGGVLKWCTEFKKMSVPERHKTISTLFKDACKICLSVNKKDEKHRGGVCQIQKDKKLKCKECQSETHDTMLHRQDMQNQSGRGRGRGRGRGFSGRGKPPASARNGAGPKRGSQFKRMNRKQRISKSEKAFSTDADEEVCTCEATGGACNLITAQCNKVATGEKEKTDLHKCKAKSVCKVHSKKDKMDSKPKPCKKHNKLMKHIDKGHADPTDYYIACASECNISGTSGKSEQVLCLWDLCSSLTFIRSDLCEKLKLEQIGTWVGKIFTINGGKQGRHPIYLLHIVDSQGERHQVDCLSISHIGIKDVTPPHIYKYVAKLSEVDKNYMDMANGNYGILFSSKVLRLFPKIIETPGKTNLQKKLPDLEIAQCQMTGKIIVYGQYSIHKNPWLENIAYMVNDHQIRCYGISSIKETGKTLRSSFRNKKGLTLKLFNDGENKYDYQLEKSSFNGSTETLRPFTPSYLAEISPIILPPTPELWKNLPKLDTFKSQIPDNGANLSNGITLEDYKSYWDRKRSKSDQIDQEICLEKGDVVSDRSKKSLSASHYKDPRPHSCNHCFKCQPEKIDLLKSFKITAFEMNEFQCALKLNCTENCEIHKKVKEFEAMIEDAGISGIYENMATVHMIRHERGKFSHQE